ncbi:RNA polymerase sigma factor [Sphingomonas sp. BT-65]|uniref:RNA polymerase sigma factor n=1 Tax=Sphingomonas sp. BT-65 TaxID=2989821 RepID=UPI0022367776|nr:RNA polymerase sigma factor [Sphingomonas sp. BT-65]MCW4461699.1 RNA polymerase sigma factor [Sphingomonas sp. BT-65]
MQRSHDQDREAADELIVIRCQLGDRRAFDALIARWAAPLAAYARRVTQDGEAAAELTQDIWLRTFRGIDRLRDPQRFRSWLFGVAHRAFADSLRRRYAALPLAEEDTDALLDETASDHENLDLVERGLARLPPVEREILTLFYLQELPIAEIAEALAIASGTVKSRLHRARHLLRDVLEEEGE